MVQIDESIRGKWCRAMREEPFPTLGKAIAEHKAFATALWLTKHQRQDLVPKGKTKGDKQKGAAASSGQQSEAGERGSWKADSGKGGSKSGKEASVLF